tara:strand:+ start:55 stop:468 length:414 start_codon:yes stop_codon:yes gene_type:complete
LLRITTAIVASLGSLSDAAFAYITRFNVMPSIVSDKDLGQHFKSAAKAIAAAICAAYVAGFYIGQACFQASNVIASFWRFLLVPAACPDDCSGSFCSQPQSQPASCRAAPALIVADNENHHRISCFCFSDLLRLERS